MHIKFFMISFSPRDCPGAISRTSHPSSISLSNVSFCVPILGTKNVTCLSDGTALRGFQKEHSLIHFLRGLAAPVIWKVRVLCYEFADVTLAWDDGQWVEAHKIILAGCSPKKSTPALMFELCKYAYERVEKTLIFPIISLTKISKIFNSSTLK